MSKYKNQHNKTFTLIIFILFFGACSNAYKESKGNTEFYQPEVVEQLLIDSVWAANGVRFDFITVNDMQFVAYFDRNRMMSVASRKIDSTNWTKKILPNQLMWDSHNHVRLGVDKLGYIHVSGNMHVHPLAYFRSTRPYDVNSMVEVNQMVGTDEEGVTYPNFFQDKNGELMFSYRSGTCGNGNILVNHFNTDENQWERYLEKPLFEGIEANDDRAAYHHWTMDSNGDFHFVWMWRWNPMVETSHYICYASTPDLKNWKNVAGEIVTLPFRPNDPTVLVDGTPSKGGLHNSRFNLFLTKKNEPVIGYVKYDEEGLTQLYLAKYVNNNWVIKQISDWDFRWEFKTTGAFMTIGGDFSFAGISDDGLIAIDWETENGEKGRYTIDLEKFELTDKVARIQPMYPPNLKEKLTSNPNLIVRTVNDKGAEIEDNSRYVIKWEAAHGGFSQDAPDQIPDGPVSPLVLMKIEYK